MQFLRQDILTPSEIEALAGFDVSFHGLNDIDDRSAYSVERARSAAKSSHVVSYDSDTFTLKVGDHAYKADSVIDLPRDLRASSVLLDATTLEFPEIVLILHAYNSLPRGRKPRCVFIYTEPEGYTKKPPDEVITPGVAFNLSSHFKAKNPIPPYTSMFRVDTKARLIAFLGFEGSRLSQVLNDEDGHYYHKVTVVFGMPPFQASWDLHALMANYRLLQRENTSVRYCSASNPRAAYRLLHEAHHANIGGETNRLAVAPFGTKPMALGAALYCVENSAFLRIVYDHPVRLKGRSFGVNRTHLYEVDLNS
ncbi:hypothetical protein NX786_00725 [Telluria mixta]|uniref:Uncharacterized protein n=1 Tax=Telluria mixta TaxID=34071 RepID=A0ABT2BT72_9BURK|nr:hypothetical protein [Telluria mixta]MCS0627871.1 hypothetical protein [Telluria mixta]WEM94011.1 hypothetical protein P0M04_21265 [Telluria mixta]